MKSAPDLPKKNFTAMLRLDHNRALSQLAAKTGRTVDSIEKLVVWGNHSPTMYPDIRFATSNGDALPKLVNDDAWVKDTFIPTVGKRGAAIIEARGLSSAASAANAALDHMRDWALGTNGKWVTMASRPPAPTTSRPTSSTACPSPARMASTRWSKGWTSTPSAANACRPRWPSCRASATVSSTWSADAAWLAGQRPSLRRVLYREHDRQVSLPVCDHYCGSPALLAKSLALQARLGPVLDVTADCEDGAAAVTSWPMPG